MSILDHLFQLKTHGTTVTREVLAGVTTFVTMAYILFVQPAMLSHDFEGNPTGLPADAVLLATCLAAALASAIMGLYARYPIALAPGMGQNAVFVTVVMTLTAAGQVDAWRTALGIVFVAGLLFLGLSLLGVREMLLNTLSESLRNSIAIGIGLLIAMIGLRNGGVLIGDSATLVRLNPAGPLTREWAVFWFGFLVTAALMIRNVNGAILIGIGSATSLALLLGEVAFSGRAVGLPTSHVIFEMDVVGAIAWQSLPYVFLFLYMDLFDTMGTLVGVTESAGLTDEQGRLARAKQAMTADAVGTVAGACLGTSTVTSYIESAAGVQQGGRTGLTAVTVAALFLLALPLTPIIAVIGSYPPITAPALLLVGGMMFRNITKVDWHDPSEAIPAFLIVLGIPLFFSIADGIALGLVAYPIIKVLGGRWRELRPMMVVTSLALLAYLVLRAG